MTCTEVVTHMVPKVYFLLPKCYVENMTDTIPNVIYPTKYITSVHINTGIQTLQTLLND